VKEITVIALSIVTNPIKKETGIHKRRPVKKPLDPPPAIVEEIKMPSSNVIAINMVSLSAPLILTCTAHSLHFILPLLRYGG
jgi:hypothetical protein